MQGGGASEGLGRSPCVHAPTHACNAAHPTTRLHRLQ